MYNCALTLGFKVQIIFILSNIGSHTGVMFLAPTSIIDKSISLSRMVSLLLVPRIMGYNICGQPVVSLFIQMQTRMFTLHT